MSTQEALRLIEQREMGKIKHTIPDFRPGDTITVKTKETAGSKDRIQSFEGVCIARRGEGLHKSFTVRKVSNGEGVERVFPLYSPSIESIVLLKKGKVRRSKLYYLRERSGKSARIVEKRSASTPAAPKA